MAENKERSMIESFIELQKELPKLDKKADNPFFKSKYVPLDEVIGKILPVLNKHGFALVQDVGYTPDNKPNLTTRLRYVGGGGFKSVMLLMSKAEDPQAQGSAITYARRYALMSMLGLVGDEDDDGNRASTQVGPVATLDRKATPAQVQALRNMVLGFGKGKIAKDKVDDAIKEIMGIENLNDMKFDDASELMNDISTNKKVPLDFDDNERDYDREDKE